MLGNKVWLTVAFIFIPKLSDVIEVQALCRRVKFFHIRLGKLFCYVLAGTVATKLETHHCPEYRRNLYCTSTKLGVLQATHQKRMIKASTTEAEISWRLIFKYGSSSKMIDPTFPIMQHISIHVGFPVPGKLPRLSNTTVCKVSFVLKMCTVQAQAEITPMAPLTLESSFQSRRRN